MIDSDEFLRADLLIGLTGKEIKIFKSRWGNQRDVIGAISTMLMRFYGKDHDIKLFDEGLQEDFKKAITDVITKHNLIENKPLSEFDQSILDMSIDRDPFTRIFKINSKVK